MAKNSEVIIGVDLDTKKFDAKIEKLENKAKQTTRDIENETNKKQFFNEQFDVATKNVERYEKEIGKAQDEIAKLQQRLEGIQATPIKSASVFKEGQRTNDAIDVQKRKIQEIIQELDSESLKQEEIGNKIRAQESKIQKKKEALNDINNDLSITLQKQEEINQKEQQHNIDLSNTNVHMGNVVKKVVKWGLALFSIRSAYSFIRSSMNLLAQDNAQMSADIEYIRWALANTLKPIIETIINLAYKLLQYINYISMAWFGVNLFARQSAEAFRDTKNQVKGTTNEAKKLQKTLAGFDEMNILQENGGTASGGGGGGITLPSEDLSQMLYDYEIPSWIQWLADNGEFIKNLLIDIGLAMLTWKTIEFLKDLGLIGENLKGLSEVLTAVGIAIVLKGIWDTFNDLMAAFQDGEITMQELMTIIGDVGETLVGVGLMMVGLNPSSMFSWAILGAGFVMDLAGHLIDCRSDTEKLTEAQDNLRKATEEYINAQENELNTFKKAQKAEQDLITTGQNLGLTEDEVKQKGKELYDLISKDGMSAYRNLTDEEKLIYEKYLANVDAQAKLQKAYKNTNEKKVEMTKAGLQEQYQLAKQTGEWDKFGEAIVKAYQSGAITSKEAGHSIAVTLQTLDKENKDLFVSKIPFYIDTSMAKIGSGIEYMARDTMNFAKQFDNLVPRYFDNTIEQMNNVAWSIQNLTNKMRNFAYAGNFKMTISGIASGVFAKGGLVTRLATGGIVNQPNRGVPVASAISGEAGREGIVPLTDSQAMETLGQAIGRYINVNATIPVYVGNRQVAKELKRIETEDAFAFNG